MKPLVIYHGGGCTDGFGAAFAAWLKLGDGAEYLPMNYGSIPEVQDLRDLVDERDVYILDFSLPRAGMDEVFRSAKRVEWYDHHKSAFEMWCGIYEHGMEFYDVVDGKHYIALDDKRSGAMLAWHNFHPGTEVPMLIQHIDDRDRWQFKLDGTKELHAALNSYKPWSFEQWEAHFLVGNIRFNALKDEGRAILRAHNQNVQACLKQARICTVSFKEQFPGVLQQTVFRDGLACNAPSFLASDLGHELANKSGTFGLVWSMAGEGQVHCSLRSNGKYDVSAIAKVFGGGGHRNAAGFSTNIDTLMSWLK